MSWLAHPEPTSRGWDILRFRLELECDADHEGWIEITADTRFLLSIDDEVVMRGPDRGDPSAWSCSRHSLFLSRGAHVVEATVWNLGDLAPLAEPGLEPGFALASGGLSPGLDTGTAPWRVSRIEDVVLTPPLEGPFHVVGPGLDIGASAWARGGAWKEPTGTLTHWHGYGTRPVGRRLHVVDLPEARKQRILEARLRATRTLVDQDIAWQERLEVTALDGLPPLLAGGDALRVDAGLAVEAILDLEDYVCASIAIEAKGEGGSIELLWDECLFEHPEGDRPIKGHRDRVEGLRFRGFGDRVRTAGEWTRVELPAWRSGRYLLVRIRSGVEAIGLRVFELRHVGLAHEDRSSFSCDDPRAARLRPFLLRGLRCGIHDLPFDTPFYEQLCYVADAWLQLRCLRHLDPDPRLSRRVIDLFDRSREPEGFVASRHPSRRRQVIPTFSLFWILLARDHLAWHGEADWLRRRMPGLRAAADAWLNLRGADGRVGFVPGWRYVDLAAGWERGQPSGSEGAGSATINLLLVLALQALVGIEESLGEHSRAAVWRHRALDLRSTVRLVHRVSGSPLLVEVPGGSEVSEHAQALDLLVGGLDGERSATLAGLLGRGEVRGPKANLFFDHLVNEALFDVGRGDLAWNRWQRWFAMQDLGLLAPPEETGDRPRSDCHPWGCHPLHHWHAKVAGVEPAAPGFAKVRVAPSPGPLGRLHAASAHPHGVVVVDLHFEGSTVSGSIDLPGVPGKFQWKGRELALVPGRNWIQAGEPATGRASTRVVCAQDLP